MALAISGVLLLLGIGQRTFLAGPSEIVYPITAETDAPYAVLDVSELAKVEGQANVVMRGDAAFSALANTRDAEAWLAPFDHVELTIDPATQSVVTTPVPGTAPTTDALAVDDEGNAVPLDPRGSDLWLDERSGDEGVSRMAVEAVGEQSIIIAGSGAEPLPKGAALVWVQDRATPWAGPLLAAGGLFAVVGAVLYLIAFDRDKRALGPRRGRSGPLLGVRNLFGGSRKSAKGAPELTGAPKRGSVENTQSLEGGEQADAVTAESSEGQELTDGLPDESGEEVITAEVVSDDEAAEAADFETAGSDADEATEAEIVEAEDADVVESEEDETPTKKGENHAE